ncbi:glycosyltransferase [Pontiella sulfatireligans]|uniref:Glycosyl transferase family 1 domain-containing protein n=1 Tax=Pontiella sulfatireligans TaxID=2750658 RepID=A0A6C2UDQ0_9BACT|nr:hypothetical protein SCARR_00317 [Pontiella sulfatireligans]
MFKQIKTLQDAGHECFVIHGRTETEIPDYSQYSFSVTSWRVIEQKNKLLTIVSQLWFNAKVARLIRTMIPDAVVGLALGGALSGALVKKKCRDIRYIYDCNELFLESTPSLLKRSVWQQIQNYVLRYADVVMHAEQNRLDYFNKAYPNKAQSFLLENLPHYRDSIPEKRRKCMRFVYLGILTSGRYVEEMINAFSSLDIEGVSLDLIGFGRKEYEDKINELCKTNPRKNVRMLPPVAHDEIYGVLEGYDAGIAFYRNTNLNNYYCAPNKVYDYIQMGMPVLTNDFPGLVDIVRMNEAGICLEEVSAADIKDAVAGMVRGDFGCRITDQLRNRYSWEGQVAGYLELFQ